MVGGGGSTRHFMKGPKPMTMVYYSKKDRKHNHEGARVHKTKARGNQMPVFKSLLPVGSCRMR